MLSPVALFNGKRLLSLRRGCICSGQISLECAKHGPFELVAGLIGQLATEVPLRLHSAAVSIVVHFAASTPNKSGRAMTAL
jgi:hypothetical protein